MAARHPQVDWIGIAERNPERARLVSERIGADFVTGDFRALLRRSGFWWMLVVAFAGMGGHPWLLLVWLVVVWLYKAGMEINYLPSMPSDASIYDKPLK